MEIFPASSGASPLAQVSVYDYHACVVAENDASARQYQRADVEVADVLERAAVDVKVVRKQRRDGGGVDFKQALVRPDIAEVVFDSRDFKALRTDSVF